MEVRKVKVKECSRSISYTTKGSLWVVSGSCGNRLFRVLILFSFTCSQV